jgi:SSS family solute:Na+ symporter
MYIASLAALAVSLLVFTWIGLRAARPASGDLDDYLVARNSQGGLAIGMSFLASGMGGWILFAPPEVAAFVGPVALAGYAVGAALPFLVFAACGAAIRARMPAGRSLAEFAQLRYGVGMRRWVAVLSVLYMLCFLAAELTAIGGITALLSPVPGAVAVIGVAMATLVYTAWGGLRASIRTDALQGWLVLALVALVGIAVWRWAPPLDPARALPQVPTADALGVALTLVIAVTAANLFHQGYWQRLWAARDIGAFARGAIAGGAASTLVVAAIGALGLLAVASGVALGTPPMPLFALLGHAPPWVALAALVLAVALVASSVDTLQSGIASLIVTERSGTSIVAARWITVALMVPVVVLALQGLSVLRLFLIADLLCATTVVPLLLGLWGRMSARAAIAGAIAGLVGAVLPGWVTQGSLSAGLLAATFPGSIPTLGPFAGALAASAAVSVLLAWVSPSAAREPAASA